MCTACRRFWTTLLKFYCSEKQDIPILIIIPYMVVSVASLMLAALSTMLLAFLFFQYCASGCSKCLKCSAWPTVQLVGRSSAMKAKLSKRNYLAIQIERVTVWVESAWISLSTTDTISGGGQATSLLLPFGSWRLGDYVYIRWYHTCCAVEMCALNLFCDVTFIFCSLIIFPPLLFCFLLWDFCCGMLFYLCVDQSS